MPALIDDDLAIEANIEFSSDPEEGVLVHKVLIEKVINFYLDIDVTDNVPKEFHNRLVEIVKYKVEESPMDFFNREIYFL